MTRCRRSVSEGCSRGIDRETRVPSPAFLNSRADDFADFAGSQIGRGCSLPPTQGQLVIASQSSYACGTLRAITVGVGGISVVVGAEAFKDSAATSVTFAGDVQSIGAEAFEACEHLANLTILGAVTQSIGQNAFKGSGLVRVVFGGSVSTGVSRWHWRRFHQCGASARPPGCVLNLLNAERLPPPVARRPRLPPAPPIYDSSLAGLVDRHRSLRGLRILGHHQHPGHPLEPRLFGCPPPHTSTFLTVTASLGTLLRLAQPPLFYPVQIRSPANTAAAPPFARAQGNMPCEFYRPGTRLCDCGTCAPTAAPTLSPAGPGPGSSHRSVRLSPSVFSPVWCLFFCPKHEHPPRTKKKEKRTLRHSVSSSRAVA